MLNPFAPQPVGIFRHQAGEKLTSAMVLVPMQQSTAVVVEVVVLSGDDWARRVEIAAIVTVAAVRARLLSQNTTNPD